MPQDSQRLHRILFPLEQDADGYPPASVETLWAASIPEIGYRIDNIPFFVPGISLNDVVEAVEHEGELWFAATKSPSAHSTLRVVFFDEEIIHKTRNELKSKGCDSELNGVLLAVDVPPDISLGEVISFLSAGEEDGLWEYQEAALRHP